MKRAAVFALLFLSGCALLKPPSGPPMLYDPSRLRQLDRWGIEGRFSLRARERVQGKLSWRHLSGRDLLLLAGPLGTGSASIEISPRGVEIRRGEERIRAETLEALSEELFGLNVPLEALRYWIRGLPAPGEASLRYRQDGLPAELSQNGWRVVYHRYLAVQSLALPKQLTLIGPGGIELKLVIDRWQIE